MCRCWHRRRWRRWRFKPDGVYVDATFGRGGHSRLILDRLGAHGRLIALDRDPDAIRAGADLQDKRLTLVQSTFSRLGCGAR